MSRYDGLDMDDVDSSFRYIVETAEKALKRHGLRADTEIEPYPNERLVYLEMDSERGSFLLGVEPEPYAVEIVENEFRVGSGYEQGFVGRQDNFESWFDAYLQKF